MTNLCNINGEVVPEGEARVSVLDRGFLFGDSVYEVIRTRGGVPFAWPEHLERLRASADGISLAVDLTDDAIMGRIKSTLTAADNPESYIRIIVTRGGGSAPFIDLAYAPGPATYLVVVRDLPEHAAPETRLAIVHRLRTDRRALDPGIKSGNYLNNVLGLAEARAAGATDCLFLNAEGVVTEASTANFFVVRGGVLRTPSLSAGLLAGITRKLLLQYCAEAGFEVREQDLSEGDVRSADELFLSSTLRDIVPVARIDGHSLPGGAPGPVTSELMTGFQEFCRRLTETVYGPRFATI